MKRDKRGLIKYRIYLIIIIFLGILLTILFWKSPQAIILIEVIGITIAFYFFDKGFDINFKPIHYFFVILILILSFVLSPLYFIYPQYDKLQHFFQPILLSIIVFFWLSNVKINLKWKLFFTFFIVLGLSGIFEIIEYLLDVYLDTMLQGVFLRDPSGAEKFNLIQSRIDDTMIDMILNIAGALLYTLYMALFWRKRVS